MLYVAVMRHTGLVLACLVTHILATQEVKRERSAKESLATALLAAKAVASHSPVKDGRVKTHRKMPSATIDSRMATKLFTDWAGVSEPVSQQKTPKVQRPADPLASTIASIAAAGTLPALADGDTDYSFANTGYSKVSYYVVLILFVLSFPGIFSLVTRSVKAKVVRKTYDCLGPAAPGGQATRELAANIVAYFQANNYTITEASDIIVFEGTKSSVPGRAAFLTLCVFFSLGALALVLTTVETAAFGGGLGNFWYLGTLAAPLAGKFYLENSTRTDQVTVKIVTQDDDMSSDVSIQGDEEEIDRFQKTLDFREKGMIYVKGVLS
jgi:hypothetical protein